MKPIRNNKARGFTLTEVLVAVFLMAIVWLAAVNIIVVSRASGALARHKVQAMYVIQQTIENLRKYPFSTISGGTTSVSIDTKGTPDSSADDLMGTRIVTVTTPNTYYKKVLIELDWKESLFGKSKTFKEYGGTYIANDAQAN